jgi:hypothetical protein
MFDESLPWDGWFGTAESLAWFGWLERYAPEPYVLSISASDVSRLTVTSAASTRLTISGY